MIRVGGKLPVVLEAQESSTPGELILGFSYYPLWSTAVVSIEQAEEFATALLGLTAEARTKLTPADPEPTTTDADEGGAS